MTFDSNTLSTLLLLRQSDIKNVPLASNLKFSCSFKFFTAEKKYTKNTSPGFVCDFFLYVAVEV